jgi:hypothetical protein
LSERAVAGGKGEDENQKGNNFFEHGFSFCFILQNECNHPVNKWKKVCNLWRAGLKQNASWH